MPHDPAAIDSYQAALDYLYSFLDNEKQPPTTRRAARYNLGRMEALLAAVDNPQQYLPSIVVAGTKGKGSTSAMLESMLRAAGYRTALWTSPHLNSYRERIQVDRVPITQPALTDAVRAIVPTINAFDVERYGNPSVFEVSFLVALRYFVAQQCQLAVIEVGLGGRYDVANVLTPLVSLVSSISYDHMRQLGRTLNEIAAEKGGIFKPGIPAVTVPQVTAAAVALERCATQAGSPLWIATPEHIRRIDRIERSDDYPVPPIPALRGVVQRENARLAVAAAVRLREQGVVLPDDALRDGLARVQWAGRLEVVGQHPTLVLDGAHNGDSAAKLAAALPVEFSYQRLVLVLAVSADKQIDSMLLPLVPPAAVVIVTRSAHPRAFSDLDALAELARGYLSPGAALFTAPTVADALLLARQHAAPADLICVTGSLFTIGAAREALGLAVSD